MVEQQPLHYRLEQIHQVVMPPDVRQFVQQNRLDLFRRQRREEPGRY
jgi:hypothetical protein